MTMLIWLYAGALAVAFAVVAAMSFGRSRRVKPVERAADCAALSVLMMFSKYFDWIWLAYVGAALGAVSIAAMTFFYVRKPPAS